MEYLLTYGWAILIIALVIGVLFWLGLFSTSGIIRGAEPGSCSVYRPVGRGANQGAGLIGTCTGTPPEYVMSFHNETPYGQITIRDTLVNTAARGYNTVTFWMYWNKKIGGYNGPIPFAFLGAPGGASYTLLINYGCLGFNTARGDSFGTEVDGPGRQVQMGNNWTFVAAEFFNGHYGENSPNNNVSIYINGVNGTQINYNFNGNKSLEWCGQAPPHINATANDSIYISGWNKAGDNFVGMLSNIQVYNSTLSANDIMDLYDGGVGGAPIDIYHLAGWWPLNGNINDYSGNGYGGNVSVGLQFNSSWLGTYTYS